MRKLLITLAIVGLALTVPTKAHAILLFDSSFTGGGTTRSSEFFIQSYYIGQPQTTIFDPTIIYGTGSSGATQMVQSGDSGFSDFVSFLTNGTDERWSAEAEFVSPSEGGDTGSNYFDSTSFGNSLFSLNGIDFQGYEINKIQVTINSAGPFENGVQFRSSLQVYGEGGSPNAIPEPATMLLFGIGSVGAFLRRKFQA